MDAPVLPSDSSAAPTKTYSRLVVLSILVAALGYFVDIYDLLLFSIVRVSSLKSLGLQGGSCAFYRSDAAQYADVWHVVGRRLLGHPGG
jgi:hypothetical protein